MTSSATFLTLCVLLGCSVAQNDQNPSEQQAPLGGDAATTAVIAGVQMQQHMSGKFAHLVLDLQSAMGWMQISQAWQAMAHMEAQGNHLDLEESDGDSAAPSLEEEEFVPGMMGGMGMGMGMYPAAQAQSGNRYDQIERSSETALLTVLKIMYLQAAQKLYSVQQSHFQMRLQVAMLQQLGVSGPLSSILGLMYQLETFKLLGSSVSIQRQDAWNAWLFDEMMETEVFDNSRMDVPEAFSTKMDHSELVAMQLYANEATIEVGIMTLEMYVQMAVMQFAQQAAGAQAPPVAAPQGAASLLEVEESAQPFMPFMHPQGMQQYSPYLRYWAAIMNLYSAQGFLSSAYMRQNSDKMGGDESQVAQYANMSRTYALYSLQQWAWLKMMVTMFEWYGMYAMMAGAQQMGHAANNAAASSALLQTEVPAQAVPAAPAAGQPTA